MRFPRKPLARAGLGGTIYAALMSLWDWSQGDPFRGSYTLGFAFYLVIFGFLFSAFMALFARRRER